MASGNGNEVQTFKLLLMGDSGVGKSSILLRYVEDKFLGEDVHAATIGTSKPLASFANKNAIIGVDFKVKFVNVNQQRIKLTIWDTAGQERFRTLTSSYYRGAHGVILVYDVTSRSSFEDLQAVWMRELRTYIRPEEMILLIIANKLDKEATREVTREEGEQLARNMTALYMECSAKTKVGIQAAFEQLVQAILHSPRVLEAHQQQQSSSQALRRRQLGRGGSSTEAVDGDEGSGGPCSC